MRRLAMPAGGATLDPTMPPLDRHRSLRQVWRWLAGVVVSAGAGGMAPAADDAPFALDHVLVKLAPGASMSARADGRLEVRSAGAMVDDSAALLISIGAVRADPTARHRAANEARAARVGLDRWITVTLAPGFDPEVAISRLMLLPEVEHASLDGIGGVAEVIPNDPSFPAQWPLMNTGQFAGGVAGASGADVHAPAAWSLTTGGRSIVVAVLDSGVSAHPDLAGRILPGWNVPQGHDITTDACNSHGTHVSGIIGAAGNNGVAIAGLCWDARILPVIVVDPCSGLESWVADGIVWAVDHGADLINMSLQYGVGSQYLHDAVLYAAAAGVPMIAATGNSGTTPPSFPARWPETIAVTATTNQDQRWPSSNYGPQVDVAAPGASVLSLSAAGGTTVKSGTSMAAPHASGIAALMRSVNPSLTSDQIRSMLQSGADDIDAPGFDDFTGHGRVNAHASVLLAIDAAATPGDLNGDGVVNGADLGSLLGYWGPCGNCDDCPADLDGDCMVGGSDLGALLGYWTGS